MSFLQEINLKLDVFEGPLDLLLHLIQKLEIDIYDIPITAVTEQYMSYIHAMQTLELEVAGEYLVMVATLMAIKSQMLLPKQELEIIDDEDFFEEEDPREALVAQLLEYRKFKYALTVLHEKEEERKLYYTKEPMDMDDYKEEDTTLPPNQINTIDLFLAFHAMLEKKKIASLLKQLLPVTMFPSKKKSPLFQSVCVKYRKGRQCRLILSSILIPNKKL